MKQQVHTPEGAAAERRTLKRRVLRFYRRFNKADWGDCHAQIDPQLIRLGRVKLAAYSELMQAFKGEYGCVKLWLTRLSLHFDAPTARRDPRPFAYVYLIWQDDAHGFHMFRERWIKDHDQWFTRVVGLVPNRTNVGSGRGG